VLEAGKQSVLGILKKSRNDRAHGEMPSLQERERLFKSSFFLIEHYLEFVVLLTDLRLALEAKV